MKLFLSSVAHVESPMEQLVSNELACSKNKGEENDDNGVVIR